VTIY